MAEDPYVGVTALAVDLVEELDEDEQYLEALCDVQAGSDALLAVLTPTAASVHQPYATRLRGAGIPVLEGMHSGLRALGHLLDAMSPSARPAAAPQGEPVAEPRRGSPVLRGPIDAVEALELLAHTGVPVVTTRRATSTEEAVAAAADAGYPVALKTAAAAHKTEVGGVVLGLRDESDVVAAYARVRALGDQVLVQPMAPLGVELSLGIARDPHLGPLVVLGAGGVLVELVAERVVALPPIDEGQALALLDELPKVSALLAGFRGTAPADRYAVAAAVATVSRLALEWDQLEIDINPLVCTPDGVLALDALILGPFGPRGQR